MDPYQILTMFVDGMQQRLNNQAETIESLRTEIEFLRAQVANRNDENCAQAREIVRLKEMMTEETECFVIIKKLETEKKELQQAIDNLVAQNARLLEEKESLTRSVKSMADRNSRLAREKLMMARAMQKNVDSINQCLDDLRNSRRGG